jgi:hypothetical protein
VAGNAGIIQAELQFQVGTAFSQLKAIQDNLAKLGQETGQSLAPANQAVKGLEQSFKDFKREQVQEGRLVGFYAREIGGFVGASAEASTAVGGMAQGLLGLASATNPILAVWAAFEIGSAAVGWVSGQLKETEENAKKAAESLEKVGDRLVDLQRKRTHVTEADVDGGKLEAAQRLVWARTKAQQDVAGGSLSDLEGQAIAAKALNDLNEQISLWEKVNGKLESYISLQGGVVAELRLAEKAVRDLALAESQARGNLDYEMAGGDGGVGLVTQKLDQVRARWEQAGVEAVASIAKARGANEAEVDALRVKAEMIGLNAQLTAATSQAEIDATKKRIAALKEEARLRKLARDAMSEPMFGPGNDQGERGFALDKMLSDAHQRKMEKEASSYDAGTFDLSGISASQVATERAKKDAAEVQAAWTGAGDAMAGAFNSLGAAVGGTGGKMLQVLGAMLAGAISVAIAYAAMAPPPWGAISMAAMAVGLIATIASAAASPMPEGRELGGSVFPGTYVVGEAGPELLTLGNGVSGSIVPNHRLAMAGAAGGGRAANLGVTINVSTMDSQSFETYLTRKDSVLSRVLRRSARAGRG